MVISVRASRDALLIVVSPPGGRAKGAKISPPRAAVKVNPRIGRKRAAPSPHSRAGKLFAIDFDLAGPVTTAPMPHAISSAVSRRPAPSRPRRDRSRLHRLAGSAGECRPRRHHYCPPLQPHRQRAGRWPRAGRGRFTPGAIRATRSQPVRRAAGLMIRRRPLGQVRSAISRSAAQGCVAPFPTEQPRKISPLRDLIWLATSGVALVNPGS